MEGTLADELGRQLIPTLSIPLLGGVPNPGGWRGPYVSGLWAEENLLLRSEFIKKAPLQNRGVYYWCYQGLKKTVGHPPRAEPLAAAALRRGVLRGGGARISAFGHGHACPMSDER